MDCHHGGQEKGKDGREMDQEIEETEKVEGRQADQEIWVMISRIMPQINTICIIK